jgi:tripeptidyl-peptidase-1
MGVCKQHGWSNNQYISNTDAQFMKFGATGRTFVVCSQDEGAPGETNDGCSLDGSLALYPEYPATSAYVLTVGASAISGSGNNIGQSKSTPALGPVCSRFNCSRGQLSEVPSMLQNAIFTTGGGFSQVNRMPTFQQTAVQAYLSSGIALPPATKFNSSNRAYPDISAMGQNVIIVMNGQYTVTGGTSAATPIVAGVMTLLNNALLNAGKAPLGFPNPLLYQMAAASGADAFNLIESGNNKCTESACCKYGYLVPSNGAWNPVTGLGTPNYGNMLKYIEQNL